MKKQVDLSPNVVTCKSDPVFKNDILMNGQDGDFFPFPPKSYPIIGKTTLQEVYAMHLPSKPNRRNSYKKPVQIRIKGKIVKVDKFLEFANFDLIENKTQVGKKINYNRTLKNRYKMYILLYKGIVTYYVESHWKKTENEWKRGKYDSGYQKDFGDESFPGDHYLACMYMLQRPDSKCVFRSEATQAECNADLRNSRPWRGVFR